MRFSTPGSVSVSAEAVAPAPPLAVRSGRLVLRGLALARRYPFQTVVLLILLTIGAGSGLASVIAPNDPNVVDPFIRLQAPSWSHIMGTDALGRDIFSRILWGGRVTLEISVASVGIATVLAISIGLVSGYKGGWVDAVVQRFVDILLAFPGLIIVISLFLFIGPGSRIDLGRIELLIVTIAITLLGAGIRVARAATMQVRTMPYVEAAQAMGAWTPRILARHVAPNIFAPVMVIATAQLGIAILIEATASFLGFGVEQPTAAWGFMLGREAATHMTEQPWLSVWPGLAIFLTVFSFNILGDTLRDVLDPRLRGSG